MARPLSPTPSPGAAALMRMDAHEALDHLTERPLALGAAGLRQHARSFLGRGFAAAVALHVAGFASLLLARAEDAPPIRTGGPIIVADIRLPRPPPLVPSAPGGVPPAPAGPTPASGIPEAVPDDAADPDVTFDPDPAPVGVDADASTIGPFVPGDGGGIVPALPPAFEPPPVPPTPPDPPEPDPNVAPDRFVPVERMAMAASSPAPEYPAFARRAGIEGRVIVEAWVTAEGNVREVRLLRGTHDLLDRAAIDAVRRWTFTPAWQNNRAVPVWVSVPITFSLR